MNSTGKPVLRIDWATHEAAQHACKTWHYGKVMPAGKLLRVGIWENERYIGCVLFGRGANNNIGSRYQLEQTQVCELVRVALTRHATTVTRIISIALRFLNSKCPGLRLIVSSADPEQGHHGGIYQGGNWLYAGQSQAQRKLVINGKPMHKRSAGARYGTASPEKIRAMTGAAVAYGEKLWKHTYLMPLDAAMREQIAPLAKPYPKRITRTKEQDAGHPPALDGVTPIRALHLETVGGDKG